MVKLDHGCDPLAGQKRMEQTSEGIPFAEPKSELASEELMWNGSYGAGKILLSVVVSSFIPISFSP